jgi:hypothetical protein
MIMAFPIAFADRAVRRCRNPLPLGRGTRYAIAQARFSVLLFCLRLPDRVGSRVRQVTYIPNFGDTETTR